MTGPGRDDARARLQWLGLGLGAALAAAALVVVGRQHGAVSGAMEAVSRPSWGPVVLLIGAIAANVILSGLMYSVLISRYGRVGVVEMQALIASAALLNFLPLRPGLFGRIAYHRAVNQIAVVDSVKTAGQAIGLSLLTAGYLAAALLIGGLLPVPMWVLVALPVPVLAAGCLGGALRIWCRAGLVRYLEVLVWAVRYHTAFALIGSPIEVETALAFAVVAMITMSVPFVGNGLGVREWAIGLAAPLLSGHVLEIGLTADLVNRAAELVVIVVLGLAGLAWVGKRGTKARRHEGTKGRRVGIAHRE